MRKNKDEKLNELFRGYASSAKMPNERVTENARRLLEEKEKVPELSLVPAAAGAGGGTPHFSLLRKREIRLLAAVLGCVLLLVAAYLLSLLLSSGSNIVLDRTQLANVTAGDTYTEKDYVPFVKENSVLKYEEFGLSEESPYYEEYSEDVILYYLQFESYGVTVDLLIEIDGFTLDELEGYQEIEDDYEADDIVLYIELDDIAEHTYVYFSFDAYQYYLEIHTIDIDLLYSVLEEIVYSF